MNIHTLVDPSDAGQVEVSGEMPFLYLAIEGDRPSAGGLRASLVGVDEVSIGRGDGRHTERSKICGRTVLRIDVADQRMSRQHISLVQIDGSWSAHDRGSSNGSFVEGEKIKRTAIDDKTVIALGRSVFVFRMHEVAPDEAVGNLDFESLFAAQPGLRTLNPVLGAEFKRIEQLAKTSIDILILGPTGTGKELAARAIHHASERPGNCIAVNCGALTETLVESQLFGHSKGAFSGATEAKPGLVRSADRGTLFLDEIGDLPLPSQAAFLRILQEREVTPVGSAKPVAFDAKLIAATHCPLEDMVKRNEFRADLLARIRGFVLDLPKLSDRLEDMGGIIASIFEASGATQATLSQSALTALFAYPWPLNMRELARVIDVSLILANHGEIRLEHLPENVREWRMAVAEQANVEGETADLVVGRAPSAPASEETRKEQLVRLLHRNEGNISAVARDMNKARNQIQRWIKSYDLDVGDYRPVGRS